MCRPFLCINVETKWCQHFDFFHELYHFLFCNTECLKIVSFKYYLKVDLVVHFLWQMEWVAQVTLSLGVLVGDSWPCPSPEIPGVLGWSRRGIKGRRIVPLRPDGEGPKDQADRGVEQLCHEQRLRESGLFRVLRGTLVCLNCSFPVPEGSCRKDGKRLFTKAWGDKTRGNVSDWPRAGLDGD